MDFGAGMSNIPTIHIAAAMIEDESGRLLVVRKAGTDKFMQAGGKIEKGETAVDALRRELAEELGLTVAASRLRYLGNRTAKAANEARYRVDAEIFGLKIAHEVHPRAEIAEILWILPSACEEASLAPLTRDHIIPLALSLAARG